MRGSDSKTEVLFTYVTPESFVPKDHPLRAIRKMADSALEGMDKLFDSIYATTGRSSSSVREAAEGAIADDPVLNPQ